MTIEKLIEIGFKKNINSLFTYYLGGQTFLHALVRDVDSFAVHLWIGHKMDINECVSLWHSPNSDEDLITLLELLTGEKVKK